MTTLWINVDTEEITTAQIAAIQELVPDMTIVVGRDQTGLDPNDVELATGWFRADDILDKPNLRWAQHWAAGVDGLVGNAAIAAKDFVLTNGSGIHGIPMAEHILGFLLAFARDLHSAIKNQQAHVWRSPDKQGGPGSLSSRGLASRGVFELAGKTMLIVGVGAIGAHTAQAAAALGVHVIGARRDPTQNVPGVERMVSPEALLDTLPEADFVVVTVPLTPDTHRMIGERELRAMKPNAILVNIGRGATIDESALIRALREGWIAGAGLDVFQTEPLPAESPLWDMDNVIITAHYAGNTPDYTARALDLYLDNLRSYRAGAPMRNVVDMQRGY